MVEICMGQLRVVDGPLLALRVIVNDRLLDILLPRGENAIAMTNDLPNGEPALPRGERLLSVDALRGFDMFWIIGGSTMVLAAAKIWPGLVPLAKQFEHPPWNGFHVYDLIFPLFLFIAGVAMPLSFEKRLARGDSKFALVGHVIVRGLVLVLLGMIYNGLLNFDWATMRYPSVLGRIGLAYLFAGLIVLSTGVRGQIVWFVGLLVGYWAALKFIPVPGFGAGDLAMGHTLTDYIDRILIPGRLYHYNGPEPAHDPEGLLATIPAIGTALAGALTGQFLKNSRYTGYFKTAAMLIAGVICLGLAKWWDYDFPINKNLWSSSFVLWCAGLSLLLLAAFYFVIDVQRFRGWIIPFVVIGSNSILIYMVQRFVRLEQYASYFVSDSLKNAVWYSLALTIVVFLIKWLFLYLLYRKRIFLRV
jgi:predicted acyltransferase